MAEGLLLDSDALFWWFNDDRQLGLAARTAIAQADITTYVSAVSPWELQLKQCRHGGAPFGPEVLATIDAAGFVQLPIEVTDGMVAGALPRHHGDPFDRMLVAQCMTRDLVLVSSDRMMHRYDIEVLPARA